MPEDKGEFIDAEWVRAVPADERDPQVAEKLKKMEEDVRREGVQTGSLPVRGVSIASDPFSKLQGLSDRATKIYDKHGISTPEPTRIDDPTLDAEMKRLREKVGKR